MRMKKPQLIRKRINVKSFKKGKASRNDIIFELLGYSSKYRLKSMGTPKNTALFQVSDSVNTYICSADYICNLSVFKEGALEKQTGRKADRQINKEAKKEEPDKNEHRFSPLVPKVINPVRPDGIKELGKTKTKPDRQPGKKHIFKCHKTPRRM